MRIAKKNLPNQPDYEEFMDFLIQEVFIRHEYDEYDEYDDVDGMMEEAYELATVKNYKLWINDELTF